MIPALLPTLAESAGVSQTRSGSWIERVCLDRESVKPQQLDLLRRRDRLGGLLRKHRIAA